MEKKKKKKTFLYIKRICADAQVIATNIYIPDIKQKHDSFKGTNLKCIVIDSLRNGGPNVVILQWHIC